MHIFSPQKYACTWKFLPKIKLVGLKGALTFPYLDKIIHLLFYHLFGILWDDVSMCVWVVGEEGMWSKELGWLLVHVLIEKFVLWVGGVAHKPLCSCSRFLRGTARGHRAEGRHQAAVFLQP